MAKPPSRRTAGYVAPLRFDGINPTTSFCASPTIIYPPPTARTITAPVSRGCPWGRCPLRAQRVTKAYGSWTRGFGAELPLASFEHRRPASGGNQPTRFGLCRKLASPNRPETRRNRPLPAAQIPSAVTTRLLHRWKIRQIRSVLLSQSERQDALPLVSGATFAHSSRTWTTDLPDLIQEEDSCQKYPLVKETFF